MKIAWKQFKSHSGYLASGGPSIDGPVDTKLHIDRAVFVASKLEAGAWGTVQSYDGAGMSGGLLHNIAVGNDGQQGSFFELLCACMAAAPAACAEVTGALRTVGWTVSTDGKLRAISTGALIARNEIRRELSGSADGAVAKSGADADRARTWADRFFRMFSDPATHVAQSAYAAGWMASGNSLDERAVYSAITGRDIDSTLALPTATLPPEVDLAMCVYHAFSVNAPGKARSILRPLLTRLRNEKLTSEDFSASLVRSLGTTKYANWTDDAVGNRNRYDRTRLVVWQRSDLWPTAMAKKLMPVDL